MDPQRPQREVGASRSINDLTTTIHDVGDQRRIVTQGLGPRIPPTGRIGLPGLAKETITGTPQEETAPEDGTIRESWVSLASTAPSRTSAVPSIFSVRASIASASTRYSLRQSSIESPVSATSPMYQEHRKNSFPPESRYCCTFCDAAFGTKTEWKLHEFEFHDRRERYLCRNCPAIFPQAALLTQHLEADHGLDFADGATEPVQHSPIRSAWGCGFCAAAISSRTDYLEHIGEHYDEGKERFEWQHTRVIEGLLHQHKVASAWIALVNKEEHARDAKLRFLWDPNTTGRSADASELPPLQDMLEFFATGTRDAHELAAAAYSKAHIRVEGNVSDLINRLYLRSPEPKWSKPAPNSSQTSPDLQPTAPRVADDVVSPISPLPAPLRLPTAHPHSTAISSAFSGYVSQVGPSGPPHRFKPTSLRRIDSSRSLVLSRQAGPASGLGRPALDTSSQMPSFDVPPISIRPRAEPQRHFSSSPVEVTSGEDKKKPFSALKINTASPVRPHTSSSTLSTHTRDGSQGFGDSTGEMMSDDSVSEPDSWLEVDGMPAATMAWKTSFQQTVDRAMERLWIRYNRDWDALVRQCVGDRNGDPTQIRESSGRVRKGALSRHTPSKGLRPSARSLGQNEEEDDDDGEGYRPQSSMSKRSSEATKKFACPFRKHDPRTYNIQDHEVCSIRSWSTISRLKEHLYRRHYKPHCPRCKQTFSDARELAEHEMAVVRCEVLDMIPPSDITTHQEKQLKSRKHTTRRQTEEEKWRDIYRLLFPMEEVPSPYAEPAEDMIPTTSESHASLNFQHFLLTEMPGLFTRTAEEHAGRHMQAHDKLPMEAIPRIIEEALHKAFRTWEATGSELSTREASVASMSLLPDAASSLAYSFGQPTAYHTPQPAGSMEHSFPQDHFGNADFASEVPHPTHADDSGFADGSFFTSGPPVNFNTFSPQYQRGPWEASLGLMDSGAFEPDLGMGGHYRGFQES
ncbi:hypothetical protein C8A00DRAFT_14760 [Chaetomidium leptoderma]|uniref:C2H2-type domain-containing protein n=1 Tax=Chaetomidium leptoderma TaxID=669021 RepID=A0AAN6VMV6_9PEZI|nr:hypothetical protein C8A00DRAFT_14760 [Chaetomidium leptoderma]